MAAKTSPIPAGYAAATPYLCCRNAAAALEFYAKAFGATEVMRFADPKSGQIVSEDIAGQTKQVLENVSAILQAAGLNFGHVVKTTIFLISMSDFQTVNEIYGSYFRENPPARSTVAVSALPRGAKVEIEVIAMAPDPAGGKSAEDTSG